MKSRGLSVTGGHIADRVGLEHASIYNPFTNTWTQVADMNAGRWYPTNTTLANGDVLTTAGNIDHTAGANTLPQIWQTETSSWRNLPGAEEILPMYPRIHVAPNGMPFVSGPSKASSYLDMSGSGVWRTVGYTNADYRDYGSSVLYDIGKVLIMGGGDPPLKTAEIIDLNSPNPSWQLTTPMNNPRRNLNATILPNGKVLVTGGTSGSGFDNRNTPVYAAEMWDPVTKAWTVMASSTVFRGYHSNSLLLPDGRVISSGSDGGGANMEIYSPPYLFQGPRPTITTAPSAVAYGQSFTVNTPDAASISLVTLLRLGSVTHAFDMDQRILRPAFSQATGALNITAPSDPNLCPPGYYMLFILNSGGVPSVAAIMRIGPTMIPAPNAPTGLAATAVSTTQINLSWADTSSNEDGFRIERSTNGTNFSEIAVVGANVISYASTGLTGGTTYHYRVRSYNVGGNSGYSSVANATTAIPAPNAPTGLAATAVSATQINLSWTDGSSNEDGFRIERSTDGTNFSEMVVVGANVISYANTGLTGGTTYYYRARSYNAAGNSGYSNAASATTGQGGGGSQVGQWSNVIGLRYQPTKTTLLPTGKVLYWSWNESQSPQIWDPATETDSPAAMVPYPIYGSGHSSLGNGNLLVSGGYVTDFVGQEHASVYNPFTNTWTQVADMNARRWYPTNTTLGNGEVLIASGYIDLTSGANTLPQVWTAANNSWRDLPGAQEVLPLYPRMHLAPNGMVFNSGANRTTRYLDTSGPGIWRTVAHTNADYHDYGSSVLYDIGKVLIAGGANPPISTTEIIDLNSPSPSWQLTAPMNNPRRHLNATLLPNGKVLITGGTSGAGFDNNNTPVHAAEMWDPVAKAWTVMASNAKYRGYNSASLLLPDARVISSGGDAGGANLEIYSPPYLFQGPRPTITTAPNAVTYGQSFTVNTPDAASISLVTLLRLGSVTHAFDMDQRILRPAFSQATGALNITAPSDPNLCPPGYYMLFILNSAGVPSVAAIMRIGPATMTAPNAPAGLAATAVSATQINLSWTDTSSNEDGFRIERSTDGTNFSGIAVVGANVISYANTGLMGGTTYHYRVRSYNVAGNSGYSNVANVTTTSSAPNAPTALTATAASATKINLSWTDGSSNEDGFRIERSIDGTNFSEIAVVGANVISYANTGLMGGTTYHYRVRSYNAAGNSSYSNVAKATTTNTGPNAPTNITATATSSSRIALAWRDNANNESGFRIERSVDGTTFNQIATVGANVASYANTSLAPLTTYYYRVRAYNAAGNSAYSAVASATSRNAAPATPSNVAATAISQSRIDLTWRDNSNNEKGFRIQRSPTGTGSWTLIATVPANTTSYSNTGLKSKTTYYYQVRGFNDIGNSGFTAPVKTQTF